jgi:hypothetical protein
MDLKSPENNPFDAFFQVIRLAQEAGRLHAAYVARVLKDVEDSAGVSPAYAILRQQLLNLARQCGFPNSADVRRAEKTNRTLGEHET